MIKAVETADPLYADQRLNDISVFFADRLPSLIQNPGFLAHGVFPSWRATASADTPAFLTPWASCSFEIPHS